MKVSLGAVADVVVEFDPSRRPGQAAVGDAGTEDAVTVIEQQTDGKTVAAAAGTFGKAFIGQPLVLIWALFPHKGETRSAGLDGFI